ncbi:MAG TPA: hypothetical protein VM658_09485 [bacterium]|nr:hypothetical protein [bacterium]
MKRIIFPILWLMAFSAPALGQDYRFAVNENRSDIFIREDGGVDIEYVLTFTCASGAHPIDVVDVGLPNNYYDLSSVRAWINKKQVSDIRKSSYIPVGVEVPLGPSEIKPGQHGTLQVTATNPHMVFPDSENPEYASVEFYPVYYGSKFTYGQTLLQVAIHFPQGADEAQVKWHYRKFDQEGADEKGRLTYIWRNPNASPSSQYKFGVSFPKSLVSTVFEPVSESEYQKPQPGGVAGFFINLFAWIVALIISTSPFLIIAGIIVLNIYMARRRKMKYFPPTAAVEGAQIKRGLTAPEAALLLELPLNKVAAMIIFGLVKKGVARVEPNPRLQLTVLNPESQEIWPYEKQFLRAIGPDGHLNEKALKNLFLDWIKVVQKKLKGFNVKKTREYYTSIVSLAWSQVQKSESTADLSKNLDEQFSWLMVDKHMDTRLKETLTDRQITPPVWWPAYHPTSTWSTVNQTASGNWVSGAEFADSVVSRVENLADRAVGSLTAFTGGITSVTNPPPARSYSSGGGSGCACACAGCACACAGGGR